MAPVIKRLQENNTIIFKEKEYDLIFKIVTQKLTDVTHEDIPAINNPNKI